MIVVTGGAGFIGSNIVAGLEERGYRDLVVCDRLRDGVKWQNIAKRGLADVVHPDRLGDFLHRNSSAIQAIVHMGAISATTETDADLIVETNFRLSMDLWQWCAAHHVRFIYASSAATYGDGQQGFVDDTSPEALARLRPMNAYGWSKLLFDRRIIRLIGDGRATPPQWVGLKYFNVYGPNEYHKGSQASVAFKLFPAAEEGETAQLFQSHNPDYEDGGQLRDFVWVGDCVDLTLWFLDNAEVSGIFNCGTGRPRSFRDLAASVYRALGREPSIEYVPTPVEIRDRYQYFTQADMMRLRAAGYDRPFTSLEQGVRTYVQDFLVQPDRFR